MSRIPYGGRSVPLLDRFSPGSTFVSLSSIIFVHRYFDSTEGNVRGSDKNLYLIFVFVTSFRQTTGKY